MDLDKHLDPFAGNFAPVDSEDDFELEVEGEIPAGLRGALFRNGPNPRFSPRDPNWHWFSGDGMVHGFYVENGRVRYRNRYARTPRWELEDAHGRSLFGSMGNQGVSDPLTVGNEGGVANTNIVYHHGKLLALEEGHHPFEMNAGTLESCGYAREFAGKVTAHPKFDPVTGEMVWFAYGVGERPLQAGMSFGITAKDGSLVRRDSFEAPYSAMVHDFLVTENYAIFPVLPLTGSLERAMKGEPAYAWEPERGAFVGVLHKNADVSAIRWFEVDPCFVFHTVNAWEVGDKLYCDVMRFDRAPGYPGADGSPGVVTPALLWRWTIDLAGSSNRVKEEQLDDLISEFPRLDDRFATRNYRHAWLTADPDPASNPEIGFPALAHYDLQTGNRRLFRFGTGDLTSEPIFIPRGADAPEGDGWITSVVWRAAENRSDMLFFEAQDIDKGPIATAKVPRRVPFGFHGDWASF